MSIEPSNYNMKNPALVAAMREMEASKSRGPWPRRIRIISAAMAFVLIAGGATWAIRAHLKANEKAAVIASIKDPREMRKAVEAGKISREDAWEAMQQAREERENKQMDEYFALKTQKDREKYLDKMIDDMEARRKEWERRAATQPTTRPDRERRRSTTQPTTGPTTRPNDRRNDPGRQLNRVQGGDPTRKAQRAAFMSAMRQRMAQRGVQAPGGGRGGWGGGGGGRGGGGPR
jgi:uncharacterized membrane protein YgcG